MQNIRFIIAVDVSKKVNFMKVNINAIRTESATNITINGK